MNLREQLQEMEGVIPYAYQDTLGFWTIGCGRLIDKRKGGRLTPDEIGMLLDNDILEKRDQVLKALPWTATLDLVRQDALVNMAFQLGIAGLMEFSQSLAALRDGHYEHAANLFLQSRWAIQTPARAKRITRQLATGARQ